MNYLKYKKMRLFLIAALVFSAACGAAENPWKTVLLGGPSVTDLVLSNLSGDGSFEFLERAEIDKVLGEHKITGARASGQELAGYFPHTDLIAIVLQAGEPGKEVPLRLHVFNAKNGFMLVHAGLPRETGEAAEAIVKLLRDSRAKVREADPVLLSIGLVRNTGVPRKYKYRIAEVIADLSVLLVNTPGVQLLERGHLGSILSEREISSMNFALAPSTRMINLEFSPGSESDKIDLVMTLTNSAGAQLLQKKYVSVAGAEQTAEDLCAFLRAARTEPLFDRKAEAKRYFDEYYTILARSGNAINDLFAGYDELQVLVDNMLALDPDNPRYRYERIFFELARVHAPKPTDYKIQVLWNFLKNAREFEQDMPDFQFPKSSWGAPYHYKRHVRHPINPLDNIYFHNPTPEQAGEFLEVMNQIIDFVAALERRTSKWNYDDPAKINNADDLYKYRETYRGRIALTPEYDALRDIKRRYDGELKCLRVTLDFIKKHPEQRKKAMWDGRFFPFWLEMPPYNREAALEELRRMLNEDFAPLEALYLELDEPRFRWHWHALRGLRDFLNSTHTLDDFKRIYAQTADEMVENGLKIDPNSSLGRMICECARYYGIPEYEIRQFSFACHREILEKQPKPTGREYAIQLVRSSPTLNLQRLLDNAPLIRELALTKVCDNTVGNAIEGMGEDLYRLRQKDPLAGKVLEELNSAFEIREYRTPYKYCIAAVEARGMIYLLQSDERHDLSLTEFDPAAGEVRKLDIPRVTTRTFQWEQRIFGQCNSSTLNYSGGHLIAGGLDRILLYNPETAAAHVLTDLPGEFVAAARILGERLYFLCGGEGVFSGSSKNMSMHSCRLDGSDRKTYFSTIRSNRENELDALGQGKVSELIETADGNLLFTVNNFGKYGNMYLFDVKTEKFTRISGTDEFVVSLRDQGDFALGQGGGAFGEAFFMLDKKTLARDWFFTQDKRDKKTWRCRVDGYSGIQNPALLVDNRYLVSGGYSFGNMFVDLEHPGRSPLLLLPRSTGVFYLPERREFIYPSYIAGSVFAVKLK